MTAIQPVMTTAGIQALFNADNTGVAAKITHIALGDSGYTPVDSATGLINEKQRVAVSGGEIIGNNQIHLTATASGSSPYWIREIGIYLEDSTLLAIYSHPSRALAYKTADTDILFSFDLLLQAAPLGSVTIDGTGSLSFPHASATKAGIVELATSTEAKAGTDTSRAVTPAGLKYTIDQRVVKMDVTGWQTVKSGLIMTTPEAFDLDVSQAATSNASAAQIYQANTNKDAALTFLVKDQLAFHIVADPETQELMIGGWSYGDTNKYIMWHQRNNDMVGQVGFFAGNATPRGWLRANGAAVSRTTYSALFTALGTLYGEGDGSTTFNLPDMRGEFARGWDNGRGVDSNRVLGSAQADALQRIQGDFRHVSMRELAVSGAFKKSTTTRLMYNGSHNPQTLPGVAFDSALVTRSANETRPRNLAFLACIKY